jgi:hypothetical protein
MLVIFLKKQCRLWICFFWPQIMNFFFWEYAVPTMDDVEQSSKGITQACQCG